MRNIILASLLAVTGCTSAQVTAVQTANQKALTQLQTATKVICAKDASLQPTALLVATLTTPVVVAVVPSTAVPIANAVAIDETVVHPDIVAACAKLGATAVAVQ